MTPVRTQIRCKVLELIMGLFGTSDDVEAERVYPWAEDSLPALSVRTAPDVVTDVTQRTKTLRELEVTVQGRLKQNDDLLEQADQIDAEVTAALMADQTLEGLLVNLEPRSFDIELSGDGDKVVAAIEMAFLVTYRVDARDPTEIIG